MIRVAINGFGRIGKNFFKAALESREIEVVAINDLASADMLAYLLKYDSVFGPMNAKIEAGESCIYVNGNAYPLTAEKDPAKLPWKKYSVDIVVESTGMFAEKETAIKHVEAGAKKVLISAPAKNVDATIVMGVNEQTYDPVRHTVISMASCTTNCLAPVAKVLNDSFGIVNGFMTTIHAYTNDQRVLDMAHKDPRRARAAAVSMIPTTTGATKAVGLVIPELNGKMDGLAIRVPVPDGSIVDFVANLKKRATREDVNKALKAAANGPMKGVLEYTEDPIVSADIIGNPHSSIVDGQSTMMVGDNVVKVLSWYDNEWGYSKRLVDAIEHMFRQKGAAKKKK
jgi:glyceraldehyde 3-phosphate dehydrogenase